MVVVVGETVTLGPVPTDALPQAPENHCVLALPPVAVNVVACPEQMLLLPEIAVGADMGVPLTFPTVMNCVVGLDEPPGQPFVEEMVASEVYTTVICEIAPEKDTNTLPKEP